MSTSPPTQPVVSRRKRIQDLALYVLIVLLLVLAWFSILGSLFSEGLAGGRAGQANVPTPTQEPSPLPTTAPMVALLSTSTPTPVPLPPPTTPLSPAPYATPTPEPGGRVFSIVPGAGDIGWWSSDGTRSTGTDSFVYAGQFDGKTLVSVLRFDLRRVTPGTPIREITLRLTGLQMDRLAATAGGTWQIDILTPGVIDDIVRSDFATLYTAPTAVTLFTLEATDLEVGRENRWTFDLVTKRWISQQIVNGYPMLLVRIMLTGNSEETLFAWDSGLGSASAGNGPELVFNLGPDPITPLPPVIITPTPQPENVLTAAAQSVLATAEAERNGTPTQLPFHIRVATPTPTPVVVTSTPTPENAATIAASAAEATAIAITTGTFTPTPVDMVTATSTPLATATPTTPLILTDMTPTNTPTPTSTPPGVVPPELIGQILFRRSEVENGSSQVFALDPNTGSLALLTQDWPYKLAKSKEALSPDGRFTALVQEDSARIPQIKVHDHEYDVVRQLTSTRGWSFDPVWSPRGDQIAFVTQDPGNDEIYVISPDGTTLQRLTENSWEWDKHPSWSPDGSQLVFWSNRETGRRQLWVMNSDGSNQRRLLVSEVHDWDPVWVK